MRALLLFQYASSEFSFTTMKIRFGVSTPFSSEMFKLLDFDRVVGNIRSYTIRFLQEEQGLQADSERERYTLFPPPSFPHQHSHCTNTDAWQVTERLSLLIKYCEHPTMLTVDWGGVEEAE